MKKTNMPGLTTGFSLIELMIVVGIIGVLAAVAFPSYTESIRKAKRADATKSILECASIQERRFTLNRSYNATACDSLTVDGYTLAVTLPTGARSDGRACVSNGNNNCYSITATNTQGDDTCTTISLDELGTRSAAKADTTDNTATCWRKT